MWSGAKSRQYLLRHIPHLGPLTSPTDAHQPEPCPLDFAWPVVATEESAKLPVGDIISHFLDKYLNPDSAEPPAMYLALG